MSAETFVNENLSRREFLKHSAVSSVAIPLSNYVDLFSQGETEILSPLPAPLYTEPLNTLVDPLPTSQEELISLIQNDRNLNIPNGILDHLQADAINVANSVFLADDPNPELYALTGIFNDEQNNNTWLTVAGIEYRRQDGVKLLFVLDPFDGKMWPNDVTLGDYSIQEQVEQDGSRKPVVLFRAVNGTYHVLEDIDQPTEFVQTYEASRDMQFDPIQEVRIPIQINLPGFKVNTADGEDLNLRSAPGTESRVLDTLPFDTLVFAMNTDEDTTSAGWVKVETPSGQEGWVLKSLLIEEPTPVPTISKGWNIDAEETIDLPVELQVSPVPGPVPPTEVPGTEVAPITLEQGPYNEEDYAYAYDKLPEEYKILVEKGEMIFDQRLSGFINAERHVFRPETTGGRLPDELGWYIETDRKTFDLIDKNNMPFKWTVTFERPVADFIGKTESSYAHFNEENDEFENRIKDFASKYLDGSPLDGDTLHISAVSRYHTATEPIATETYLQEKQRNENGSGTTFIAFGLTTLTDAKLVRFYNSSKYDRINTAPGDTDQDVDEAFLSISIATGMIMIANEQNMPPGRSAKELTSGPAFNEMFHTLVPKTSSTELSFARATHLVTLADEPFIR